MEKHIENLVRRLGMNSQNSSKPPSSDPPGTAVVLPRRLRKKRGSRYVERILNVGATCRLQGRSLPLSSEQPSSTIINIFNSLCDQNYVNAYENFKIV
jgi:hypothetical protein